MTVENMIEISSCVISVGLLLFLVPLRKLREASLSLVIMQSLTWILSGVTVQFKLIEYPVRYFSYAFRTSFTFEFIIFPVFSILFNLYFPKKGSKLRKSIYSLSFPSVLIIFEIIIEKYTDNIEYIKWNWFYSWVSMLITLLLAYGYYRWFFKKFKRI
ncbi:CBO0543 family protein [Neobacillus niacini]|uniref:CBO0543 family protein n=1 Tax=Neobacillus niacini TaxID=86668 RepID=UPI00203D2091|nr:CBO0543 family protein [Neobacillus niacini]MCM3692192.1 hypothetical protein [Neobacillus niacini]